MYTQRDSFIHCQTDSQHANQQDFNFVYNFTFLHLFSP